MAVPPPLDRIPPPRRPWVFAVEDDAVQLTWRAGVFGPGPLRFTAADTSVTFEGDGGPGVVTLDHLPHGRPVTIHVEGRGVPDRWRRLRATTLPAPPGEELFRFATVSDLHIGTDRFGFFGTIREEPPPGEPHPVRATRAALAELASWGARLVLVKGDLTNAGRPEEWEQVGDLLAGTDLPVEMLPGNHDNWPHQRWVDPWDALARLGHEMTRHFKVVDVPGLRIVMIDSTVQQRNVGRVATAQPDVLEALRDTDRPAFVTLHHYAQRLPFWTFWPPGVPSPEANAFVAAVARVQPATVISSGHTHRHRRRSIGSVVLTEVGSPKDYPGTWAGYVVHEGGIRQVVRRVASPDVVPWLDRSADAALHLWGRWSPGLLHHRCFTHVWPAAARS